MTTRGTGSRRGLRRAAGALAALAILAAAQWLAGDAPAPDGAMRPASGPEAAPDDTARIAALFQDRRSGAMVEAAGQVIRVLADDRKGSRHQRFLLLLAGGQTLLVAHNIDLAPRVPLARGDVVRFRGQYEWNDRGGVLHWTHHDPDGRRPGGWLEHEGRRYR